MPRNPYQVTEKKKGRKLMRIDWCRKLTETLKMSPVEQKWIVRILMGKLDIRLNHESILKYLHEDMITMYSAVQNLEVVCRQLADKEYMRRKKLKKVAMIQVKSSLVTSSRISAGLMVPQMDCVKVGSAYLPMLADRTSFQNLLAHVQQRINNNPVLLKEAARSTKAEYKKIILDLPLDMKHPPFIGEIKMDGERMLFHFHRGLVTCHSRRNNWYSEMYSPCLGPAIRRALRKWDVDCVFDGEVISWDNYRNEVIPFGMNRSVSKYRREYLEEKELVDERDVGFQRTGKNDLGILVGGFKSGDTSYRLKERMAQNAEAEMKASGMNEKEEFPGSYMWLTYVIFDIVYLGGPGAKGFLESIGYADIFDIPGGSVQGGIGRSDEDFGGSIMHVALNKRKRILYTLIEQQKKEVEICHGEVVTPDGRRVEAEKYFREGGMAADRDKFDLGRNSNEDKDEHLEKLRGRAIDSFFIEAVEKNGEEGLVIKELSSPYLLGTQKSRSKAFWRKLKKDYEGENIASDIDVLVLGAYFADGRHRRGMITSYLVGLASESVEFDGKMRYIPFCKVSGATFDEYREAQRFTGFRKDPDTGMYDLGKWTMSGTDRSDQPEHVSKKSFQRTSEGDDLGWTSNKLDWPDVWIKPEDSFMLEVKAAEIVGSVEFAAGMCLRFPRVVRMR